MVVAVLGGGTYALFFAGSPQPNGAGSVNLSKGLVGHWKLDGNAKDSTPYSNDGVVSGATATTDYEGTANGAMSFNGTNQYVRILANSALKPTVQITVATWLNPSNITSSAYQSVVSSTEGGSYQIAIGGTVGSANCPVNSLCFQVMIGGGYKAVYIDKSALSNGSWYHVVATYDGSSVKLYVNAALVNSTAASGSISEVNTSLCLGNEALSTSCSGQYFSGSLSDVRIYNRAINANEVQALYDTYDSSTNIDSGQAGLVGYWKLNGDAKDSTPYGANGTLGSAITPTADREGIANGAEHFDGTTNSIVTVPNASQLNQTGNLTVSAWMHPTTASQLSTARIVSKYDGTNINYLLAYSGTTGQMRMLVDTSNGRYTALSSSTLLDTSKWYYVVGVANAGNLYLYVNGVLAGSTTYAGTIKSSNSPLYIGRETTGSPFTGDISDVRLYNRALSAQEITKQYNSYNSQINLGSSGGAGSASSVNLTKGLVGYWPFSGNAKDTTPYSDDGAVNGATLTTDRFGRANSAYSFNGTNQYLTLPSSQATNSETVTVSAWINTTQSANPASIIEKWNGGGGTVAYPYVLRLATDHITFNAYDATHAPGVSSPVVVNDGKWHLVTGVRTKGGTLSLYIDGVLSGTATDTTVGDTTNSAPVGIGDRGSVGAYYFAGSIDDVRIYNRALSADEVVALYNLND